MRVCAFRFVQVVLQLVCKFVCPSVGVSWRFFFLWQSFFYCCFVCVFGSLLLLSPQRPWHIIISLTSKCESVCVCFYLYCFGIFWRAYLYFGVCFCLLVSMSFFFILFVWYFFSQSFKLFIKQFMVFCFCFVFVAVGWLVIVIIYFRFKCCH